MIVMAINHDVEDYDRRKAAFDDFPPAKGGAIFHRLNRNVDNAHNITVVCGWNSVEDANAFRDNPELKARMDGRRRRVQSTPLRDLRGSRVSPVLRPGRQMTVSS